MSNQTSNVKAARMIIGYPFALIIIGILINMFVFGISPIEIGLPEKSLIVAFIFSFVLLVANHIWLMTSTELARLKGGISTTPEEWAERGQVKDDANQHAWDEVERRHNAHRNTTENIVYFIPLALTMLIIGPSGYVFETWVMCFALARLGYTYAYLSKNTDLRGIFMSLSLLPVFAMASYLVLAVLV